MVVFLQTEFGQAFENGALAIPDPRPLTGTTQPALPLVIVADAAIPLKQNMLRPYPGKNLSEDKAIFNYRLSRAHRIIENSFGILAARWRLFRRPIVSDPNKVISYAKAAIALHNYLRTTESAVYCPPGFIDGEDGSGNIVDGSWMQDDDPSSGLEPLTSVGSNRSVHIWQMLAVCPINVGECWLPGAKKLHLILHLPGPLLLVPLFYAFEAFYDDVV